MVVQVQDIVLAMDPELRAAASGIAQRLRRAGRSVDLVLEDSKRMKWAFKVATLRLLPLQLTCPSHCPAVQATWCACSMLLCRLFRARPFGG